MRLLSGALPGDVKKLLRAFRHEREAAARNIRKVVAKQRADLRSAMVRYSVEFLGRGSTMQAVPTGSMQMSTSLVQSARGSNEIQGSVTMNLPFSGNERDVLYDMGSAGLTGFTPTVSSMGSAILSNGHGVATPLGNAYVDEGTSLLPPLIPNR